MCKYNVGGFSGNAQHARAALAFNACGCHMLFRGKYTTLISLNTFWRDFLSSLRVNKG